tara:strand:- start:40 stop:1953 length:1914 start_codon:yes stop_codon:yes gene_type:complete
MSSIKKALMASSGGAGLDVDEVFSTYLYEANNAALNIVNDIDLSGEGGLVWGKSRVDGTNHRLYDTEGNGLYSNYGYQSFGQSNRFTANNNGFSLGTSSGLVGGEGYGGPKHVTWTFRKAPKFFDVVTWSGNSTSGRTISHGLGQTPGMIIVKRTNGTYDWICQHRSLSAGYVMYLNLRDVQDNNAGAFTTTLPTSTVFTVGDNNKTNETGGTYVAYIFAHNDSGDGEFGPDGDQDIVKCGTYTGNGLGTPTNDEGLKIELGFEPQWVMIKSRTWSGGEWNIYDTMRGLTFGPGDLYIAANNQTSGGNATTIRPTPTGFQFETAASGVNSASHDYIYMAIRRGSLFPPQAATDVFAVDAGTTINNLITTGFAVDMSIAKGRNGTSGYLGTRLTGDTKFLLADTADAEGEYDGWSFDISNGFKQNQIGSNNITYMWKRAPSYFDAVNYIGNGAGVRTVSHNLTVAPDMLWLKRKDGSSPYGDWNVQSRNGISASQYLVLNVTSARTNSPDAWDSTYGTSEVFTVGPDNNVNGFQYVVYLFATVSGVSKAGSVTHSGTTNVDCGFSNGSRFVLVKRYDASGGWYLWDSVRGIVSGNDPYLLLNSAAGEVTNTDLIDPLSSGFTLTSSFTGGDYIFYAIA